MESAHHGNKSIRVVSPDRPTKGSVSLAAESSRTRVLEEKITDKAGTSQGCGGTTCRRNSSIGMSLLGEVKDPVPQENELSRTSKSRIATRDHSAPRTIYAERPVQSYRPLVGSGAAAAYEALRHDFYVQKQQSQRRMSSLSFGSAGAREFASKEPEFGTNYPNISNTNQCPSMPRDEPFEMLKLHYFNLVNEIQETAMMLSVCERHQLKLRQEIESSQSPGGPEPPSRSKRPLPTDGSFEVSVPTKIVKL